jgi:hypothetical protein
MVVFNLVLLLDCNPDTWNQSNHWYSSAKVVTSNYTILTEYLVTISAVML